MVPVKFPNSNVLNFEVEEMTLFGDGDQTDPLRHLSLTESFEKVVTMDSSVEPLSG